MTPDQQARREDLVKAGDARALDPAEVTELTGLERQHHAFRLMCTRTAPLNPIALGYTWGERLVHAAKPDHAVELRTEGCVLDGGDTVTLMAATQRIAAEVKRGIALADWSGPTGRLGDIAGLEHPPRGAAAPAVAETEGGQEPVPAAKPRKATPPAAMGDLFD